MLEEDSCSSSSLTAGHILLNGSSSFKVSTSALGLKLLYIFSQYCSEGVCLQFSLPQNKLPFSLCFVLIGRSIQHMYLDKNIYVSQICLWIRSLSLES